MVLKKTQGHADLTIFDPKTIIDQATFEHPFHYNQGIKYVFVNGTLVLNDSMHTVKLVHSLVKSIVNIRKY